MAVEVILVPDGIGEPVEVYTAPTDTTDANAWLERVGAEHLKFGTTKGQAYLKNVNTGKILFKTDTISNLCYWLAFNPIQMRRIGLPYYDWYRPDTVWNSIRPVEVIL